MLFATGMMNDGNVLDSASVFACAKIVHEVSKLSGKNNSGGFGNLRFSSMCNVRPYNPFYPGSFHGAEGEESELSFALAMQCADLGLSGHSCCSLSLFLSHRAILSVYRYPIQSWTLSSRQS